MLYVSVMKHPNMKTIVITEVERMMFRPNVGLKAQYVFLNFLKPNFLFNKLANINEIESVYFFSSGIYEVFFFFFRYYACCFLNQIPLSHQIKAIASKLVSLYFSFFKVSYV